MMKNKKKQNNLSNERFETETRFAYSISVYILTVFHKTVTLIHELKITFINFTIELLTLS